jgi:hypothetical protein
MAKLIIELEFDGRTVNRVDLGERLDHELAALNALYHARAILRTPVGSERRQALDADPYVLSWDFSDGKQHG